MNPVADEDRRTEDEKCRQRAAPPNQQVFKREPTEKQPGKQQECQTG